MLSLGFDENFEGHPTFDGPQIRARTGSQTGSTF